MNSLLKTTSVLAIFIVLLGCTESKETTSKTSGNEVTSPGDNSDQETELAMEKISPDGTKNATLACKGTSQIEVLIRDDQEMNTDGFDCRIVNSSGLKIVFSRDDIELAFELYGTGSFPINIGDYKHMTKGTDPYAIVHYKDQTNGSPNEDLTLTIFDGQVRISDYGMSSNVLCGSFDITDGEGNIFQGKFYETVTSF